MLLLWLFVNDYSHSKCLYSRYTGYLHDCDYQSNRDGNIYSESNTEPNMSEYKLEYLFPCETNAL